MESVPDEVLAMILRDYLCPDELISCRLISKRFRFVIDCQVYLKELIIYCNHLRGGEFRVDLTHVSDEPVNYKNSIKLRPDKLWLKPSFPRLFANLNALELNLDTEMTADTLNALNGLAKLEKLVLNFVFFTSENDLLDLPVLSPPNLKILSLNLIGTDLDRKRERFLRFLRRRARLTSNPVAIPKEQPKLVVSSKIEKLFLTSRRSLSSIRLSYPKQVIYLRISDPERLDNHLSTLTKLRTLKFHAPYKPCPNILEMCANLEEINIAMNPLGDEYEARTRRFLGHLITQKSVLGRSGLRIYFNDVLMDKPIEVGPRFQLGMQVTNYQRLANGQSPDCKTIHFEKEVALVDEQKESFQRDGVELNEHHFPTWFFSRFHNIRQVLVYEISNENRFIWFLKQCKNLCKINFRNPCLTQPILNLLPNLSEPFRCLEIVGIDKAGQDGLDYGPVFRISQIEWLDFQIQLDLQIVPEFFEKSRFLGILHVHYENGQFTFKKDWTSGRITVEYWRNNAFPYVENIITKQGVYQKDLAKEISEAMQRFL